MCVCVCLYDVCLCDVCMYVCDVCMCDVCMCVCDVYMCLYGIVCVLVSVYVCV